MKMINPLTLSLLTLFSFTLLLPASSANDVEFTQGRIVGGQNARNGEFPFMASWYYRFSGFPSCGGSLIAPNLVLTAGHCMDINGSVRIGCSNALGPCRGEANVRRKIRHPQYNGLNYDFMVLELDRSINGVAPIPLNFNSRFPSTNQDLTVIGFGTTSEGGDVSLDLKKVEVPTVSFETCVAQYGRSINKRIHLCAGFKEGGKDSCQGDSGGPAFMNINGVRTQVGVVSFGSGCARRNTSGIYARTSGESGWLKTQICTRGAGTKPSYCSSSFPSATQNMLNPTPSPTRSPITPPSPTKPPTPLPTRSSTPIPTKPPTPLPTRSSTPLPTRAPTPQPTRLSTPLPTRTSTSTTAPITPAPNTPSPTGCSICDNNQAIWMIANDILCDSPVLNLTENCMKGYWMSNKVCQHSCYHAGFGYVGDYCCDEETDSPTGSPVTARPTPTRAPTVSPRPTPTPAPTLQTLLPSSSSLADNSNCIQCDDTPVDWMIAQNFGCVNSLFLSGKCKNSESWRQNKYCQLSCFNASLGYEGDECCRVTKNPTPPPTSEPTHKPSERLSQSPTQDETNCEVCENERNSYMFNVGMNCESKNSYIRGKCNKNGTWRQAKYCQKSCYELQFGYEGDKCCA